MKPKQTKPKHKVIKKKNKKTTSVSYCFGIRVLIINCVTENNGTIPTMFFESTECIH